ncbi:MAG: maleylpyruvate isomerase family mycothiol-dependent enzyme [Actinomycetota bacterium]|nr:maleylpyruvate isomerase family mycothiol-dependent enzyme [Actinomycetota bacterium]
MNTTTTPIAEVRPIQRAEALTLATTENERVLELLRSLDAETWSAPTDCTGWNVRDLAGHVLGGMEDFSSAGRLVRLMRAAKREAGDGAFVDGMTAVQVRERSGIGRSELLRRMEVAGPRAARFRHGVPAPLRALPLKQELLSGVVETWKLGYLLDTILTRDTWMHRVDLARAAGRELVLTESHDGRVVADVVAEWARRHGQPFSLALTGPAGGAFTQGADGERFVLEPVEFCRILSGRTAGEGLLAQEVPF